MTFERQGARGPHLVEFARHGTQPSGVAMTFDDLVEFARRGTQPSARVLASNGHHVRTVLR